MRLCEIEHARSVLLTSDMHKHMHDTAAVSHDVLLLSDRRPCFFSLSLFLNASSHLFFRLFKLSFWDFISKQQKPHSQIKQRSAREIAQEDICDSFSPGVYD